MVVDMVAQGGLVVGTEVVVPRGIVAVVEAVIVPLRGPRRALAAPPDAEKCFKKWTAPSQGYRISLSQFHIRIKVQYYRSILFGFLFVTAREYHLRVHRINVYGIISCLDCVPSLSLTFT